MAKIFLTMMLTPLEALVDNPGKSVTLVGDDIDLIVLLLYHTQERRLFPGEPLFHTKKSTWDINLLVDSVKGQPFLQHSILSLHAISVCDTISRSFNKGKLKFFGVSGEDTEYWEAAGKRIL